MERTKGMSWERMSAVWVGENSGSVGVDSALYNSCLINFSIFTYFSIKLISCRLQLLKVYPTLQLFLFYSSILQLTLWPSVFQFVTKVNPSHHLRRVESHAEVTPAHQAVPNSVYLVANPGPQGSLLLGRLMMMTRYCSVLTCHPVCRSPSFHPTSIPWGLHFLVLILDPLSLSHRLPSLPF